MDEKEEAMFLLAEEVGLLLGCLRNYRDHGRQAVDLEGALRLEPDVAALLSRAREFLPRAG
jgi:hypothetical protein